MMPVKDSGRPQLADLRYARNGEAAPDDALAQALDLARTIEELLEETRSLSGLPAAHTSHAPASPALHDPRAHSTRMARAMAASLVDELEALVRPARKTTDGTSRGIAERAR